MGKERPMAMLMGYYVAVVAFFDMDALGFFLGMCLTVMDCVMG